MMPTDVGRRRRTRLGASLMILWASTAGAADQSSWLKTTTAAGEKQLIEIQDGQVAYEVSGPNTHRTMVLDPENTQNVIVQLRGAPLGPQQRSVGSADRRTASAFQAVASAAEAIDAQHAQVRQALADIAARGGQARALTVEPYSIPYEYRDAFNGFALRAPGWIIEALRANPNVLEIRPDVTMRADLSQSVPLIGAAELHAQGVTGEGVIVGIIDTGIDYTHPDLGGGFGAGFKVIGGYDFVNRDNDPMDDNRHGTHVAGIVAANGATKGVAPGAKLVAYKVLNAGGSGSTSNIIAAIDKATNPDGDPTTADALDVINLSLGSSVGDPDDPTSRAIDNAVASGVVAVISAGNSGPGHGTVGSPGMARRALTVGATDKTDRLAIFSSRGPSERIYGVKPEVVAPGVSIVSTVPGNATGSLNGTSMAAPHVAGAAALLLQARPDLSPDAVKSVLMTSARDLGLGIFAQGAGRIDLPAAARRTTIVTPAAVSFGVDDIALPTFEASTVLTVTNLGAAARHYSASAVTPGLPGGIVVTVSPTELDLAAGETGSVTVALNVDNTTVPNVPTDPPAYEAKVRLQSPDETVQVPLAFLKGAQLRFTFDVIPSQVLVRNAAGQVFTRRPTSRALALLLPAGTYDAYVSFLGPVLPPTTPLRFRNSLVTRQGIVVQTLTTVDLQSTEAVHVLTAAPVDELGAPAVLRLQRAGLRIASPPFELASTFVGFPGTLEFAYSPIGAPHLLDWLVTSEPAPTKSYSFTWHRAGISTSETLTNRPADLTPLEFQLDADPGTSSIDVINWNTGIAGEIALSTGALVKLAPPFAWKRVVMPKPAGESLFGYVDHDVLTAPAGSPPGTPTTIAYTTPLFQAGGGTTSVSLFDISPTGFLANLQYRTARTHFDIGLEPYSWFGKLTNAPLSVRVSPAKGIFTSLFSGQTMDSRLVPQLPYELSQGGTVARSGTLPGDRPAPAIPVAAAGRYTLKISGPAGTLEGQATATTVKATFDTNNATDKNPPVLSHFRILADNTPSKAFCIGTRAEIRFRVTDDVRLRSVGFQFRLGPHGWWLPLPLVRDGDDLVARLPLGFGHFPNLCDGRETQAVPISLRIQASDAQGNSFETDMTPAYARRLPRFSPVPLTVDRP